MKFYVEQPEIFQQINSDRDKHIEEFKKCCQSSHEAEKYYAAFCKDIIRFGKVASSAIDDGIEKLQ